MTRLLLILIFPFYVTNSILLPIATADRKNISNIHLTSIGQFGLTRKARKAVPEHLHTGIDIKRPIQNYDAEPVFPIAKGKVISKRTDGPFANIIIEHTLNGVKFWSLYEHVAGIKVNVNDEVDPANPIARFMNKKELNKYGWQFDHFHLELLKVKPQKIKPDKIHPSRFFISYTLTCFNDRDLEKYYFEPISFLKANINPR